jgi:hypothetical protein
VRKGQGDLGSLSGSSPCTIELGSGYDEFGNSHQIVSGCHFMSLLTSVDGNRKQVKE